MSTPFEDLQRQVRALSARERATLARILIEELDTSVDPDAEQLWIEEAQRRYEAFRAGELEASPGEDVMARTRRRFE